MLFHLLVPFADQVGPFNLFRYITFRSGGALVTALFISFFRWEILGPTAFIGLRNYQFLLTDPNFHKAIFNTVYYTVIVVPIQMDRSAANSLHALKEGLSRSLLKFARQTSPVDRLRGPGSRFNGAVGSCR